MYPERVDKHPHDVPPHDHIPEKIPEIVQPHENAIEQISAWFVLDESERPAPERQVAKSEYKQNARQHE